MSDTKLDPIIEKRLKEGRARHNIWKPVWAEPLAFIEGRQFVYRYRSSGTAVINELQTQEGDAKPRHRARTVRNRVLGYYLSEVSAGTQRVPAYEVTPTDTDPQIISAARLAEKVLGFLYGFLNLRRVIVEAYGYTVACGEGFVRPYWDPTVGDQLPEEVGPDGQPQPSLFTGEICADAYGPQEVFWQPGVSFDKSPYHCIITAKPLDQVKQLPGYNGKQLRPDVRGSGSFVTGQLDKTQAKADLVEVIEYLELPSKREPQGRRMLIANDLVISGPEPYPVILHGPDGPEPCLLKMSYIPTPWRDRDMGLVEHMLDAQRTVNDAVNKCVAGETLVTTADGLRRADEINGRVEILAGDGVFREVEWGPRGKAQLWRVEFDDGSVVHVTQNHRWLIRKGGKAEWVTTPLLQGQSVPVGTLRAHTPVEDRNAWWRGVQNGLMWGDGTVEHHVRHNPIRREYAYGSIRQYGSEDNVALIERFFPGQHTERREYAGLQWIQARGIDPAMKQIPAPDMGLDYIRGFLAGAIASDGHVTRGGQVIVSQKSRSELEAVGTLARSVGIAHREIRRLENRRGASWHQMALDRRSFVDDSGADTNLLLKPYHHERLECEWAQRAWHRTPCRKVASVQPVDRIEQTYCCVEPVTHSFVLGCGLVTGQSIEWKNLALKPQMLAPVNSLRDRITDEPGAIFKYNPVLGLKPEWRQVPPIPAELFTMRDQAVQDMEEIASQRSLPGDASGKALAVFIERDSQRRQFIVQSLADFHSKLGRTLIALVQERYTEPRLLAIQGRRGVDYIPDFRGADLKNQMQVSVLPGSIEPRTRQALEQKVMNYAQMGWITGEDAMTAIESGSVEMLVERHELQIAKQQREINQLVALGNPRLPGGDVPMVAPYDEDTVHLGVLHEWMLSRDFENMPPEVQHAAELHDQMHQRQKDQKAAQAQAAQAAQAQGLGMQNAAKPQLSPMPSLPGMGNGGGP